MRAQQICDETPDKIVCCALSCQNGVLVEPINGCCHQKRRSPHFSRKLREGFLVKKRWPCTTQLSYTAPQHLPRSPNYTAHHSTYTADIHHIRASVSFSLISKAGVGLAGVGGMHPSAGFVRVRALYRLRVLCVSKRSRCGAVGILAWDPSAGFLRVEWL